MIGPLRKARQWHCTIRSTSFSTPPPPPLHSDSDHANHLLDRCSNITHLLQTHAFILTRALDKNDILLSRFIHASASLGFTSYAYSLFTYDHRPSIFLYNNIIWALSSSHAARAILLFNSMGPLGLRPDSYSFPFVLKAVIHLRSPSSSILVVGKQVHCRAVASGLDSHRSVATSLVQMYSSCGHVSCCARKLFDGMSLRDAALWNAVLSGYAKAGDVDNARKVFDCMPEKERDVFTWTALISGYVQAHDPNEAILLFRRMQVCDVKPDEIAVLAVLSACADLGAIQLGEWTHNYIEKHNLRKIVPLCNALIDMYAKSGNISKALQMFENMTHRTVVTWTTMIAGLALHGLGKEALRVFSHMEGTRFKPNEVTFIAVLSACSHVGLVEMGRYYFASMQSKYGIEPKIDHYGCMIDLLGRAGYLQEAKELVSRMPFDANAAIWGSILAAATRCGDAELATEALHHLIKLEPHHSGNYSLLSNTYASLGWWREARIVRKAMRDTGVEKMPGVSFIEVNNRVYEFIAGDKSNMYFVSIFDVLHSINVKLKMLYLQGSYRGTLDVDD